MMTWVVEVDLAMQRPPRVDATVTVQLSEADFSAHEAELVAIDMACARGIIAMHTYQMKPRLPVTAVGSRVTRTHDDV